MENFKNRFETLKAKALTNWFTKELINKDMQPNEIIATVISETRNNKTELGLGMEFFKLLNDWTFSFTEIMPTPKDTIDKLNNDLK